MNCNLSACRHCLSSDLHFHHKILKIYRHVYKEVVRLSDMVQYIDCSGIQPYKCNSHLVLSLNPLPHSGAGLDDPCSCNTCKRKLVEPCAYRYCSIFCKVQAVEIKPDASVPPFIFIQSPFQEAQEENANPQLEESAAPPLEETPKRQHEKTSAPQPEVISAPLPVETAKSQLEETCAPSMEETSAPQPEETSARPMEESAKPLSFRKRKRKGTPHRAPFF